MGKGPWRQQGEMEIHGEQRHMKFQLYNAEGVFVHIGTINKLADAEVIEKVPEMVDFLTDLANENAGNSHALRKWIDGARNIIGRLHP